MLGLWCCPHPQACVICGCSCVAPTPERPSLPVQTLLYFHLFRSVGPRGRANLLATTALPGSNPPLVVEALAPPSLLLLQC